MNMCLARAAVIGFGLVGTASWSAAQPFESVLTRPVVTLPALDNRAVVTIKVNASTSRAYLTVGGPPTVGGVGFMHLTIWNRAGGPTGFAAYDMPGTNGTFDVRSVSEDSSGNFYVAGYCSSSATGSARTFVAKFSSSLGFVWCLSWSGADTSDPRVRAIALSSGNVVVMDPVNTGIANRPHTRMTCFSGLGTILWNHEYTTANCDALRLADMVEEPGGWVYAVGRLMPSSGHFSTACVLAIDPDPAGGQGQAVGLWTSQPSMGFGGDFLSVDIGQFGDLFVAGTQTFFGVPGPSFVTRMRVARLSPHSGMAAQSDALYSNAPMLPAIGAAAYVPFTNGSTWASAPVFAVGGNGSGPAGRLLRVDALSMLFASGTTFGGGSPVETAFYDVAIDSTQPAEVVLAGDRIPVAAGSEEAYLVKTGPFGSTACSTSWSATRTIMSTTTTSLTPVTQHGNTVCNGSGGGPTPYAQITLPPHVFSVSVVVKKQCGGNVCTGDFNEDTIVDDADFVAFVPQYDVLLCEDAAMPSGCPADFNLDGFVDDDDFLVFVAAYNTLMCE